MARCWRGLAGVLAIATLAAHATGGVRPDGATRDVLATFVVP